MRINPPYLCNSHKAMLGRPMNSLLCSCYHIQESFFYNHWCWYNIAGRVLSSEVQNRVITYPNFTEFENRIWHTKLRKLMERNNFYLNRLCLDVWRPFRICTSHPMMWYSACFWKSHFVNLNGNAYAWEHIVTSGDWIKQNPKIRPP